MTDQYLYCLSVRQPWASLIVGLPDGTPGPKDVENRNWLPGKETSRHILYRSAGLLIHASQALDMTALHGRPGAYRLHEDIARLVPNAYMFNPPYTTGAIIGLSKVRDAGVVAHSVWASSRLLHWLLAARYAFATPFPYRGRLGLFKVPRAVVEDQLR